MTKCAKCGAAVALDSAFCGACGQPVSTGAVSAAGGAAPAAGVSTPASEGAGLTMNLAADAIAGLDIRLGGRAYRVGLQFQTERIATDTGQRLADIETELRVQRE